MYVLVLLLTLRTGRVIPVGSAPANTAHGIYQARKILISSHAPARRGKMLLPAEGQKRRPGLAGDPAAGHSGGGGGQSSRGHEDRMEEQELPIEIFLPVRLT
jgi:hypothetical protein